MPMAAIFDALPGIEVPVGGVSRSLADLWRTTAEEGGPAPEADDARATQVNFVLHLGLDTTVEDALAQFEIVERFSRRYPSRVVVLCPLQTDVPAAAMRAKIYGECFLGRSKADKRCVEFVMLSYSHRARPFLENQVSICLSTDLPLYYWPHRFSSSGRLADYRQLLTRAKRVLLDSATAPPDALQYSWPNPNRVRDLVYSRLLPVRQTIGQFLTGYPASLLVDGLQGVTVEHEAKLAAEARVLVGWLGRRLAACGLAADSPAPVAVPLAAGTAGSLAVRFDYRAPARFFRWRGDLADAHALFEADFGNGRTTLAAAMSLLAPEVALSEAMFF